MNQVTNCPWQNGYYKLSGIDNMIFKVDNENVTTESFVENKFGLGSWKFGEFGTVDQEILEQTGKKNYNVDINLYNGMWLSKGVINDAGDTLTLLSMAKGINSFKKMTADEIEAFKNSADPFDAPTSHYKIQPEFNDGKLLWISGAPGSGKSTTALILSRRLGYVYYEADCFAYHANPYISSDVDEPSIAIQKQKPLKNIPKNRIDAVNVGGEEFGKLMTGQDFNTKNTEQYYSALCKDIRIEKKRMGGNWVVAQAVPTKHLRDHIKKELGDNVIFIILDMKKDDQRKRIIARHGEGGGFLETLVNIYDRFESPSQEEKDVITINVNNDMSRDNLVDEIVEYISK